MMRITCPNCGAQYEVDSDLIPSEGRDVQCSSCSNIWVQHSDGTTEDIGRDATSDNDTGEAATDTKATDADDPPQEPAGRTKRRELDDEARKILREEAERETAKRRAARGELETQAELDLPADEARTGADATAPSAAAPARDDASETVDAAAFGAIASRAPSRTRADANRAAASRGDLLPDIEEINSSLSATEPRPEIDAYASDESRRVSGFRRGFLGVLSLTILAIAVYVAAPALARSVPALEPPLAGYVGGVNDLRADIDNVLERAAQAIGG